MLADGKVLCLRPGFVGARRPALGQRWIIVICLRVVIGCQHRFASLFNEKSSATNRQASAKKARNNRENDFSKDIFIVIQIS